MIRGKSHLGQKDRVFMEVARFYSNGHQQRLVLQRQQKELLLSLRLRRQQRIFQTGSTRALSHPTTVTGKEKTRTRTSSVPEPMIANSTYSPERPSRPPSCPAPSIVPSSFATTIDSIGLG